MAKDMPEIVSRRSLMGAGAGLALASTAAPARAQESPLLKFPPLPDDHNRMGVIGIKTWPPRLANGSGNFAYQNFVLGPDMYPECQRLDGNWLCTPFPGSGPGPMPGAPPRNTFLKKYSDTVLSGILFCDVILGGPNVVKLGIWLTEPGTWTPANYASVSLAGPPGQNITFDIPDPHMIFGPAGRWGVQVYAWAEDPTTILFNKACMMQIREERLPPDQA